MTEFEKMQLIQQRRAAGDKRRANEILAEIEVDLMDIQPPEPKATDVVGWVMERGKKYEVLGDGSRKAV